MKFNSEPEVWEVVRKMEQCEYSLTEFDHANHLAVGMAYLSVGSFDEALARMRASLKRFSAHHGKMGYHETITRFWLMKLAEVKSSLPELALWQHCNAAALELANKELIFTYYEKDRLMSDDARAQWMSPDTAAEAPK